MNDKINNPLLETDHIVYTDKNGEKFLCCIHPERCKIDHSKDGEQITQEEFVRSDK